VQYDGSEYYVGELEDSEEEVVKREEGRRKWCKKTSSSKEASAVESDNSIS